jgi:hypothetical protein
MSRTRRDQARGRGQPHPYVPHLYRKVPQTPGEAVYPHLRSAEELRKREQDRERTKKDKP